MILKVMLGSLGDAWISFSYGIQYLGIVEINTGYDDYTCKTRGDWGDGRLTKRSGKLRFIQTSPGSDDVLQFNISVI